MSQRHRFEGCELVQACRQQNAPCEHGTAAAPPAMSRAPSRAHCASVATRLNAIQIARGLRRKMPAPAEEAARSLLLALDCGEQAGVRGRAAHDMAELAKIIPRLQSFALRRSGSGHNVT